MKHPIVADLEVNSKVDLKVSLTALVQLIQRVQLKAADVELASKSTSKSTWKATLKSTWE